MNGKTSLRHELVQQPCLTSETSYFRLIHTHGHTRWSVQEAGRGLLQTAPTSLARRTIECHGKQGFAFDGRLCCQEGVLADPPELKSCLRFWALLFSFLWRLGLGCAPAFPSKSVLADVPMLFSAVPIGLSALSISTLHLVCCDLE